jgi:uncharacterized protein (TIGR03083 family)
VAADIEALIDDLAAETDDLTRMLADARPADWSAPTPAEGWSVGDQVGHLWFFDREATRALADPDGFLADLEAIAADIDGYQARPSSRDGRWAAACSPHSGPSGH